MAEFSNKIFTASCWPWPAAQTNGVPESLCESTSVPFESKKFSNSMFPAYMAPFQLQMNSINNENTFWRQQKQAFKRDEIYKKKMTFNDGCIIF